MSRLAAIGGKSERYEHLHRHHPLERTGSASDFTKGQYSRAHEWAFDGGAVVPACPSPHIVPAPWSDSGGVDPEEAFVASLVVVPHAVLPRFRAARRVPLDGYVDEAEGVLDKRADGQMAMTSVTLHPRLTWAGEPPDAAAHRRPPPQGARGLLHRQSVTTEVTVETSMNLGRLNHVGVATPRSSRASRSIATCRRRPHGAPFDLPAQGVRVCFVDTPNSQIELIEPLGHEFADREIPREEPGRRAASCLLRGARHRRGRAEFEGKGARVLGPSRASARTGRRSSSSTPRTWAGC